MNNILGFNFVREKKIFCGEKYLEVDIYPMTVSRKRKGKRSKKEKESLQKQKNLNDKNAKRRFVQIAESNFGEGDLILHLTYNDDMLPKSLEELERNIQNFLRRLKRLRKKLGLEDLKYLLVTSYTTEEQEEYVEEVRPHHHLIVNGNISRDLVEDLWRAKREKGEKKGKRFGYANAQRVQYDYVEGITRVSQYIVRNLTQKRKWTCSQNLTRPESRTNDYKYTKRKVEKIVRGGLDKKFWEKQYPDWEIRDVINGYEAVYNEITGWSIYLKLRRKE